MVSRFAVGISVGLALACSGASSGSFTCPAGEPVEMTDDGLVEMACWLNGSGPSVGPTEFRRDGKVVVSGTYDEEGERVGQWTLYGPDGSVRTQGDYDKGRPTGTWRFPDGTSRVWVTDHFEPRPPQLHFSMREIDRYSNRPGELTIEIIDANLERGRIAYRSTWTANTDLSEGETPCAYPGLADPKAGVRLGLLAAGQHDPLSLWDVYVPTGASPHPGSKRGPCTTKEEAGRILAEAKAALTREGLDPARRTPMLPPQEIGQPHTENAHWRFEGGGHRIDLVAIPRPGVEVELALPSLAFRDWYSSTMINRTHFFEVQVDGTAVWWFVLSDLGMSSMILLEPRGVVVQGDRASLVMGINTLETVFEAASPVFSLSKPVPVGDRLR